ncbi:uncharacterized protein FIESC28_04223 [Fusarium coffeatum]|uniref:Uncharacterized protein n=1 Tax=Fusarium coffeatum TaxID=231269 RepID=A0A366S2S6_9HYPO|nr:uncharacterized protein FIESC28_04223 [Fusarium coffeatum]RBR22925.1 hypothetical protein FIESC28_04223 [Fusarium coffeatum]
MGDRIWKIKIDPYDQVIALTQHMINEGISNLYTKLERGQEVEGAVKPKPGNVYADQNNWAKNVIFGEPCVIVQPDYSNVRNVRFRIAMKTGKIQLYSWKMNEETGEPVIQKLLMDIDDWHVTIPIDVGFVALDTKTKRGKAVADRSAAKGKPNHSIMELLLDLKSMALENATWEFGDWGEDDYLYDADENPTRPPGWKLDSPREFNQLNPDFQTTMSFCLQKISNNLMQSNLTSMGFAVIAPDINARATFEVNNARYMTYPWTNPDTNIGVPAGLDGDSRLNYLLYLETVGSHTPPLDSQANAVLNTRMGNWTEGRKPGTDSHSKFGTFVLSRANFMESFLLPKLSSINRIMSMDISEVRCWAEDHFFTYKWSVGATFSVGLGKPEDDKTVYALNRINYTMNNDWQQDAKDFLNNYTGDPGSGSQVWRYQDIEWGNSAKHQYTHKGSVEVWMSGDTITFTRAYTTAGSNTIVYEGGQWTKFEYKIDPSVVDPNIYGKLIAETKWAIKFQMAETTDGGMQFEIDVTRPTTEFKGNYNDSNSLKALKSNLESRYKTAGDNFEWYINSIRNCLQGQERFTLPASGVYFFSSPVMNAQGDLVCGLEYNGNPTLGGTINNGTTTVRDEIPRGDFVNMPGEAKFSAGDSQTSKREKDEK